jgi:hypothetical protein
MLPDKRSFTFSPLAPNEMHLLRTLARTDHTFDAVAARACRLGYHVACLEGRLDPEAAIGLAMAEAGALAALAQLPAESTAQLRTKRSLFHAWSETAAPATNLAAMLAASNAIDVDRIALMKERLGRQRER